MDDKYQGLKTLFVLAEKLSLLEPRGITDYPDDYRRFYRKANWGEYALYLFTIIRGSLNDKHLDYPPGVELFQILNQLKNSQTIARGICAILNENNLTRVLVPLLEHEVEHVLNHPETRDSDNNSKLSIKFLRSNNILTFLFKELAHLQSQPYLSSILDKPLAAATNYFHETFSSHFTEGLKPTEDFLIGGIDRIEAYLNTLITIPLDKALSENCLLIGEILKTQCPDLMDNEIIRIIFSNYIILRAINGYIVDSMVLVKNKIEDVKKKPYQDFIVNVFTHIGLMLAQNMNKDPASLLHSITNNAYWRECYTAVPNSMLAQRLYEFVEHCFNNLIPGIQLLIIEGVRKSFAPSAASLPICGYDVTVRQLDSDPEIAIKTMQLVTNPQTHIDLLNALVPPKKILTEEIHQRLLHNQIYVLEITKLTIDKKFIDCFKANSSLTKISLDNCNIDDAFGVQLIALMKNKPIISISLAKNRIGNQTLRALGEWLETSDRIFSLINLEDNDFGNVGIQSLLFNNHYKPRIIKVTELNIKNCGIADRGRCEPIIRFLEDNSFLQRIRIGNNRDKLLVYYQYSGSPVKQSSQQHLADVTTNLTARNKIIHQLRWIFPELRLEDFLAWKCSSIEFIEYLSHNPSSETPSLLTPLDFAIYAENSQIVGRLLDTKPPSNKRDKTNQKIFGFMNRSSLVYDAKAETLTFNQLKALCQENGHNENITTIIALIYLQLADKCITSQLAFTILLHEPIYAENISNNNLIQEYISFLVGDIIAESMQTLITASRYYQLYREFISEFIIPLLADTVGSENFTLSQLIENLTDNDKIESLTGSLNNFLKRNSQFSLLLKHIYRKNLNPAANNIIHFLEACQAYEASLNSLLTDWAEYIHFRYQKNLVGSTFKSYLEDHFKEHQGSASIGDSFKAEKPVIEQMLKLHFQEEGQRPHLQSKLMNEFKKFIYSETYTKKTAVSQLLSMWQNNTLDPLPATMVDEYIKSYLLLAYEQSAPQTLTLIIRMRLAEQLNSQEPIEKIAHKLVSEIYYINANTIGKDLSPMQAILNELSLIRSANLTAVNAYWPTELALLIQHIIQHALRMRATPDEIYSQANWELIAKLQSPNITSVFIKEAPLPVFKYDILSYFLSHSDPKSAELVLQKMNERDPQFTSTMTAADIDMNKLNAKHRIAMFSLLYQHLNNNNLKPVLAKAVSDIIRVAINDSNMQQLNELCKAFPDNLSEYTGTKTNPMHHVFLLNDIDAAKIIVATIKAGCLSNLLKGTNEQQMLPIHIAAQSSSDQMLEYAVKLYGYDKLADIMADSKHKAIFKKILDKNGEERLKKYTLKYTFLCSAVTYFFNKTQEIRNEVKLQDKLNFFINLYRELYNHCTLASLQIILQTNDFKNLPNGAYKKHMKDGLSLSDTELQTAFDYLSKYLPLLNAPASPYAGSSWLQMIKVMLPLLDWGDNRPDIEAPPIPGRVQ